MSEAGAMLARLPLEDAKRRRMDYGAAKYGGEFLRNVSFIGEAYVEAVDIMNYLDLALEAHQLDATEHATLRNAVFVTLIEPLRRMVPR